MRPRFLIPVLAVGFGAAALSWAREPALQLTPRPSQLSETEKASAPVLLAAATPAQPAAAAPQKAPAQAAPASDKPADPAVRYRVPTSEAPRHIIAGGKGRATLMLNPSTGATAASLTLLELQPGGEVPEHVHATSVEILYIEEGAAEMTVSGQTLRVGKGDAVYIPAGEKHSARVVSKDVSFKAVQVYAGPGPEARFTQGPRENPPHGK